MLGGLAMTPLSLDAAGLLVDLVAATPVLRGGRRVGVVAPSPVWSRACLQMREA